MTEKKTPTKKKAPTKADWGALEQMAVDIVSGKRAQGPNLIAKIREMRG